MKLKSLNLRLLGLLTVLALVFVQPALPLQHASADARAHAGMDQAPGSAPKPPIPQHRPGHLARTQQLDTLVASGAVSDPLAGNSTVISWDKISLIWQNTGNNAAMRKTYDVALGAPFTLTEKQRTTFGSATVQGAGNLAIAAGHFLPPDGWTQSVAAWEYPTGKIQMNVQGYNASLAVSGDYALATGETVAGGSASGGGLIRVVTGDFNADGYDEIVLAWEGASTSLNLKVYTTNQSMTLVAKGKIADETLASQKCFDVATGDFNGDGVAEIAVAFQGSDSKLHVKIYKVDPATLNLTAAANMTPETQSLGQIKIATGDFNADRLDEIAIAFNLTTSVSLYTYQVSSDLQTLTKKGTTSVPAGHGNPAWNELVQRALGLGAGDFNADGVDELALISGGTSYTWRCNVGVFSVSHDASLTLTTRGTLASTWVGSSGGLSLSVGDLNRDSIAEIVVVTTFGTQLSSDDVDIGVLQISPDLNTVAEKGTLQSVEHVGNTASGPLWGHVAVAVGAFDDTSARVGQPTYSHMAQTIQNIAVINAPPKHKDTVNGVTTDVNVTDPANCVIPPCTYAKYETETKQTTKMSVTTSRDWSVSAEAELSFGHHVEASLGATYGESFEKTTSSFKSTEFGQDVEADTDDVIVRLEQDLNVWEYPVYADSTNQISGYIVVTWPDKVDPACTTNCEAAMTARVDGTNPISGYRPNHQWGNVMSYSTQPPTDISSTIKSDVLNYLGSNYYQMWLKWSDVQDSETKQSSKLDLDASLKLSGFGQSLTTKGTYSQGSISVNQVGFEQSTSLHVYFWGIDQKYSYGVRPFVYWAKPDGHLVLDYVVQPATAQPGFPPTWWQNTYNWPDLTFNLPWSDEEHDLGDAYRLLTKEITFDPPAPKDGDTVKIRARVRNYGLVGSASSDVAFYLGDPAAGGTYISGATGGQVTPMSFVDTPPVSFNTTGHGNQTLDIYAVVNPYQTAIDLKPENNKAHALLPVRPAVVGAGGDLYVGPGDITFDPPQPNANQAVTITAQIHGAGQTFVYVPVEFWDGDPGSGGKLIGGTLIPMVTGDEAGTATVRWNTSGLRGTHNVWVRILPISGDRVTTDNQASKLLELQPFKLYLPLVAK